MAKVKGPAAAREFAKFILEQYGYMRDENATQKNINEELQFLTRRIDVDIHIPKENDEVLVEEALARSMSSLPWSKDDDLLAEANRRGLSTVTTSLENEAFDKEARSRGYRRSIREFPISEIKSYLKIQGIG